MAQTVKRTNGSNPLTHIALFALLVIVFLIGVVVLVVRHSDTSPPPSFTGNHQSTPDL